MQSPRWRFWTYYIAMKYRRIYIIIIVQKYYIKTVHLESVILIYFDVLMSYLVYATRWRWFGMSLKLVYIRSNKLCILNLKLTMLEICYLKTQVANVTCSSASANGSTNTCAASKMTSCIGRSLLSTSICSMTLSVSMPPTSLPNIVCLPSSCLHERKVMKLWK